MAGATIAYTYPVTGAVAPTALQSKNANSVVADATYIAADTDLTNIVHNMNLDPADGTLGTPQIDFIATAQGTALTMPKFGFVDKDTISITKALTGVNTGVTWRVTIKRPHSISR